MSTGAIEIDVSGLALWLQFERFARRMGLLCLLLASGAISQAGLIIAGLIHLLLIWATIAFLRWNRHRLINAYRRRHALAQLTKAKVSKPGPLSGKNRGMVFAIAAARVALPLALFAGLVLGVGLVKEAPYAESQLKAILGRVGLLAIPLCLVVDSKLRRKMHSLAAYRFQDLPLGDKRPPVLILRSFADDEKLSVKEKWRWRHLISEWDHSIRFEEVIARAFWAEGPVIAIGQPDEHQSPPGAIRDYTGKDDWRAKVQAHIAACSRIYIIVAATEALKWEFAQLV